MSAAPASTDGSGTISITVITGFVGSGKTTLILNLIPQLRQSNPGYRLALVKNEIGDLNVDSQLAEAAEMTGTQELLGACICCTNVGQMGDALAALDRDYSPDRIIIETSGSAEPIKLMVELKRLARETGRYELDGIVSVIDVENWSGYANTSYTAKLQAKQTDLIVLNKWENVSERELDTCLDRLGDLDVETPQIKSDRGWISKDLLFGLDTRTAGEWSNNHSASDGNKTSHNHNHNEEMECLSVTLTCSDPHGQVDMAKLDQLLSTAPKDEVYRIKAIMLSTKPPNGLVPAPSSDDDGVGQGRARYILNWSFGRCTWTKANTNAKVKRDDSEEALLRMSIFTARYESNKWQKRIEAGQYITTGEGNSSGHLTVVRVL